MGVTFKVYLMKAGTLFSGGLGAVEFALRYEQISHEIIFACVIDKYARKPYLSFHNTLGIFFIGVNETKDAWNWGNVQSIIGTPIIVGDSLYIYAGGRALNNIMWDGDTSTGLAKLRRDGFVSMLSTSKQESFLLTEPIMFDGEYFFVNAEVAKSGKLLVELLDSNGSVIPGFSKNECNVMKSNSTKQMINWKKSLSRYYHLKK